jgi:GntR family transcriptional regulator
MSIDKWVSARADAAAGRTPPAIGVGGPDHNSPAGATAAAGPAEPAGDRLAGPAGGQAIEFRLDPASGVPTYLQLVQQVEQALRLGYLMPGDQLPRVKDVVGALAINPNTVLKAYRELEHKGLAAGRPGQGTFIIRTLGLVPLRDQAKLRADLLEWLHAAAGAGLDADGINALIATTVQDFRAGSGSRPGTRRAGGPASDPAAGPGEVVA